jgi:thymidylate synthase
MNQVDLAYKGLISEILNKGELYHNQRRNAKRLQIPKVEFSLSMDEFPLLSVKDTHYHSIITELIWFLRGDTDISFLQKHNVKIWDKDAKKYFDAGYANRPGDIGNGYGYYWKKQLPYVIENFKKDKWGARHLVSTFNYNHHDPSHTALPPCHDFFQLIGRSGGFDLAFGMRAWDVFLGAPFNIASYATLGHMIAQQTGIPFLNLHVQGRNVHLYENSFKEAELLLSMDTKTTSKPQIDLSNFKGEMNVLDVGNWEPNMFKVSGYDPNPAIKVEMLA